MQVTLKDRENLKDTFSVAFSIRGNGIQSGTKIGDVRKALMVHLFNAASVNNELYKRLPVGNVQPELDGMHPRLNDWPDDEVAYRFAMSDLAGEPLRVKLPTLIDVSDFTGGADALVKAINADATLKAAGTGALVTSRALSQDAYGEGGRKMGNGV